MRYIKIRRSFRPLLAWFGGLLAFNYSVGYFERKRTMRMIRTENKIRELNELKNIQGNARVHFHQATPPTKPYSLVVMWKDPKAAKIQSLLEAVGKEKSLSLLDPVVFMGKEEIPRAAQLLGKLEVRLVDEKSPQLRLEWQPGAPQDADIFLFKENGDCIFHANAASVGPQDLIIRLRAALKVDFDSDFLEFYRT